MRLNKLIKKFANYTKVDILNIDGSRLFPVDDNSRFKTEHKIQDLKNIKFCKSLLLRKNQVQLPYMWRSAKNG